MLHMADRSGVFRNNSCLDVLRHVTVLKMIIDHHIMCSAGQQLERGLVGVRPTRRAPTHQTPTQPLRLFLRLLDQQVASIYYVEVLSEMTLKFSVFWVGSNM